MILSRLEKVINQVLSNDHDTLKDVAAMKDKILEIELAGLDKSIYIAPHKEGVYLLTMCHSDVHVTIKGTPLALLRMAMNKDKTPVAFDSGVAISGDLALGQHLQSIMKKMDLDWEELLSEKVGDVAAHQIGNAFKGVTSWVKNTHETLELNLSEYLRIESQLIPEKQEIDHFMNDVETLRSDLDRLEQRLDRILVSGQTS